MFIKRIIFTIVLQTPKWAKGPFNISKYSSIKYLSITKDLVDAKLFSVEFEVSEENRIAKEMFVMITSSDHNISQQGNNFIRPDINNKIA